MMPNNLALFADLYELANGLGEDFKVSAVRLDSGNSPTKIQHHRDAKNAEVEFSLQGQAMSVYQDADWKNVAIL